MTRKVSSVIATIMATIMLALFLSTPVKSMVAGATEKVIKYVSIGDSMANGFGIEQGREQENNGYLVTFSETYPSLVREYLQKKNPDKKVELTQLAVNGMRVDDLRYVLEYGRENGYKGDNITCDYLNYADPEIAKTFQKAVAEADYITMGLGCNNLLHSFLVQAMESFGEMIDDVTLPQFNPYLEELIYGDKEWVKSIAQNMYTEIRNFFLSLLNVLPIDSGEIVQYIPMVEKVVGYLVYALVGFTVNYRYVLDEIVAVNPDVTLVLIGLPNVFGGVQLSLSLGNISLYFDGGDIMSLVSAQLNYYIASLASLYNLESNLSRKYSYKMRYAEIDKIDTVGKDFRNGVRYENKGVLMQEMGRDLFPLLQKAQKENFDLLTQNGLGQLISLDNESALGTYYNYLARCEGKEIPLTVDEMLTMSIYKAFEGAVIEGAKMNRVDVSVLFAAIGGFESLFDTPAIGQIFSEENVKQAIERNDYQNYIAEPLRKELCNDKRVLSFLFITSMTHNDGRGIHPSIDGHKTCANAVIKALECDSGKPIVYLTVKPLLSPALFTWRAIKVGDKNSFTLTRAQWELTKVGAFAAYNGLEFVYKLMGKYINCETALTLETVDMQTLQETLGEDILFVTTENESVNNYTAVLASPNNGTTVLFAVVALLLGLGLVISVKRYKKA